MPYRLPGVAWLGALGARLSTTVAYIFLAALLALGGIALLVAALYLWLATLLQPALAALLTGVALFALAGLVALIGKLIVRLRYVPVAPVAPVVGSAYPAAAASLVGSELGVAGMTWLRGHLPQVAVAAVVAGFVLGVSPRLRAAIWRHLQ